MTMNANIKRIATESLQKVTQGKQIDMNNLEATIDAYVIEIIRTVAFECTDVIREKAKAEKDPVCQAMLKVTAIDVLDHFGL